MTFGEFNKLDVSKPWHSEPITDGVDVLHADPCVLSVRYFDHVLTLAEMRMRLEQTLGGGVNGDPGDECGCEACANG